MSGIRLHVNYRTEDGKRMPDADILRAIIDAALRSRPLVALVGGRPVLEAERRRVEAANYYDYAETYDTASNMFNSVVRIGSVISAVGLCALAANRNVTSLTIDPRKYVVRITTPLPSYLAIDVLGPKLQTLNIYDGGDVHSPEQPDRDILGIVDRIPATLQTLSLCVGRVVNARAITAAPTVQRVPTIIFLNRNDQPPAVPPWRIAPPPSIHTLRFLRSNYLPDMSAPLSKLRNLHIGPATFAASDWQQLAAFAPHLEQLTAVVPITSGTASSAHASATASAAAPAHASASNQAAQAFFDVLPRLKKLKQLYIKKEERGDEIHNSVVHWQGLLGAIANCRQLDTLRFIPNDAFPVDEGVTCLANIRHLRIDSGIIGGIPVNHLPINQVALAMLPKLHTLVIDTLPVEQLIATLCHAHHLRELHISNLHSSSVAEAMSLVKGLERCRRLEQLTITTFEPRNVALSFIEGMLTAVAGNTSFPMLHTVGIMLSDGLGTTVESLLNGINRARQRWVIEWAAWQDIASLIKRMQEARYEHQLAVRGKPGIATTTPRRLSAVCYLPPRALQTIGTYVGPAEYTPFVVNTNYTTVVERMMRRFDI